MTATAGEGYVAKADDGYEREEARSSRSSHIATAGNRPYKMKSAFF